MFKLIPKEEKFFVLYKEFGEKIVKVALLLKSLIDDFTDLERKSKEIKEVEHACDLLAHQLIKKLNRSFITPFDREDIFALISVLDDIVDVIDSSAQRMILYNLAKTTAAAKQLSFIIWQACVLVAKAVDALKDNHKVINDLCVEINAYEKEADRVRAEVISDLFRNETNPIELIKWKEIYENLELITDKCEDAANIIERIVVKNA